MVTIEKSVEGLRAMIAQALQAYKLAQATYLREEVVTKAEQQRSEGLLAVIQQVEQAARDLLEKAGLAHIAGVPLHLDEVAAPIRRNDESVAATFAAAQLALADLQAALFQLAGAFTDAGRWKEARRVAQSLFDDPKAPLYTDARDLVCETHYRPGVAALEAGNWDTARQEFEAVLKVDPAYRDAGALLRETYMRPARQSLEKGQWENALQYLDAWRQGHGHAGWPEHYPPLAWLSGNIGVVQEFSGHTASVSSVAFSPDGQMLASGSYDGTVKVWEAATGCLLHTLKHTDHVYSVAFSPNGRLLASGSRDHTVKVYEAATGHLLNTLAEHKSSVTSAAFSPDGRLLASGSEDCTVKVWEAATGHLLNALAEHKSSVSSAAFSPDGRLLASGSYDGTVKVWEVATGRLLYDQAGDKNVASVAFSPDGRLLASGGMYSMVVWEAATGYHSRYINTGSYANGVAFSPNGRLLAAGLNDNSVKVGEAVTGRLLCTLIGGHTGNVYSVAFSPNGRLLASGSTDTTIKVWGPKG